jgi:hypothetical protein
MFAADISNIEARVQNIMPTAGTVKNFYAFVENAPGAGASWTFTVRKNGANTALGCQISGAATQTCSDTTDSVSFVAGDLISVIVTSAGGPTNARGQWTATFTPP